MQLMHCHTYKYELSNNVLLLPLRMYILYIYILLFQPSWKEFIPGLCVRGLCKTDKCITHAQGKVVHYHGFDRLNLGTDSPRFKCPNCGAHIYPVKIVLYHCTGDVKGELWNMKTHSKEDVINPASTNKDITVNPNEKRWLSLTVKNIRY